MQLSLNLAVQQDDRSTRIHLRNLLHIWHRPRSPYGSQPDVAQNLVSPFICAWCVNYNALASRVPGILKRASKLPNVLWVITTRSQVKRSKSLQVEHLSLCVWNVPCLSQDHAVEVRQIVTTQGTIERYKPSHNHRLTATVAICITQCWKGTVMGN